MTKAKIAEILLAAVSALIAAAKAFIKFIGSIGKLRPQPVEG